MDAKRWTVVSDSPHDHEREALAWLRTRLPDREPFHVWANFEFTTHDGRLYEVDALAVTDNGVHLIEIKSHPGRIDGDAGTWQWTTPQGKFRQMDNPRVLANRKAKALKSLLESSKTFRNARNEVPYVAEAVFLSDPELRAGLNPNGRWMVFGRDADPGRDLPPERAALGGIVAHLTSLTPDASGRPRRRLDRAVAAKVVKAMNDIGVRAQTSRREIGDYLVGELLDDVGADTLAGVAYQDFLATHRSLGLVRRLRIYPLERNATAEQRQTAARAAQREFKLLRDLDHRGVVRPVDYTEHERGPVLFFDYDPAEVSLAAFLADPTAVTLTVEQRLGVVRQIAETLHYANGRGVYHRSLSPSAVLVAAPNNVGGIPRVRLANWHTGARESTTNGSGSAEGTSGALMAGTAHVHVEALAASDAEVYRAPEFRLDEARPAGLDVFSLGALSLYVLTGTPPAASVRQLRQQLASAGALDPTSVADGIDPGLVDLVIGATWADPAARFASVEAFLERLDGVEADWASQDEPGEVYPLDARKGDRLAEGRFEVLQRLGEGSTAVALLVADADNYGQLRVLKVASRPEHNGRIVDEAAALDGLQHACIVRLESEPLELSGLAALLITYAGPKVDPDKADNRHARTLATRLVDGPVGAELAQRWGEDLLDALRYLEGMGRAHRDIKPENLGVAPRGENNELHLVLFDFSLSSAPIDRIEAGTPGYVDPFLGTPKRGRWDPAADRYAATVTLFQMTTGTRPRYGDGTADPALVPAPPSVDPSLFDPAAAIGLTAFFTRALQADVADRYGTADEMYWAWHEAFRASAAPATRSNHPDSDDDFVIPDATTLESPLAGLPLSKRAVSALERAEVVTVDDLLTFNLMSMRSMTGVGAKTRGEVREAVEVLRWYFEPETALGPNDGADSGATSEPTEPSDIDTSSPIAKPPAIPAPAGPAEARLVPADLEVVAGPASSLVGLAIATLPRPGRGKAGQTQARLARALAGLDPEADPWASQAELGQWLGITPARVSQLVTKLRDHWATVASLTELRQQLQGELDLLAVASAGQLAARLLATDPEAATDPFASAVSVGLVRLAVLTEEAEGEPGWIVRRRHGADALLARRDAATDPDSATAQALADYAVAIAGTAANLVDTHEVVPRIELLDHLRRVPVPSGVPPLPDAHLADLAADLVAGAGVNARLELYRHDLQPLAALRAIRRAVAAARHLTPAELAARVAARFPNTAPLPRRPELDGLLAEAGIELVWQPADGAYRNSQLEAVATSVASASVSRYPTSTGTPIPPAEIDNAAEFERRLTGARDHGGVLVLVTDPRELAKAGAELAPLASATIDLDAAFVDAFQTVTANGKPSWATLTAADAAGPSGPAWGRLRQVVDWAADIVSDQIAGTSGTVLITNPGLLARYDRLDLVARWRDRLHAGTEEFTALWMLVPGAGGAEVPMLDGRPVPVISRNEWSHIPLDWLKVPRRRVPEPAP